MKVSIEQIENIRRMCTKANVNGRECCYRGRGGRKQTKFIKGIVKRMTIM